MTALDWRAEVAAARALLGAEVAHIADEHLVRVEYRIGGRVLAGTVVRGDEWSDKQVIRWDSGGRSTVWSADPRLSFTLLRCSRRGPVR